MVLNTLKKSVSAGILIAAGATVKLMCDNTVVGSVLFLIEFFFI